MVAQEWSNEEVWTPTVNQTQEFLEIAHDFANPLDIVREGISNAYDAKAKSICISFDVVRKYGEHFLRITMQDDGGGMDQPGLQAFFDLGNSTRRDQREDDPSLIGEKGHGTKIFFNSDRVDVSTTNRETVFHATMDAPFVELNEGRLPKVKVQTRPNDGNFIGTKIEILGYNRNRRDMFSHDQIKDHILWFTKHGSVEAQFRDCSGRHAVVYLSGVDKAEEDKEAIPFGHHFPEESASVDKLFEEHLVDAPQYYSKKWIRSGSLTEFPDIKYEMVFAVEGDRIKRESNSMLRGRGRTPKPGSYQVQERYGLWLARDYIPIQRKNEWITSRGSEFTKFHAFVNCQALQLTANRGSIENTPKEIIDALEKTVRSLFTEITSTDEWTNMEWLEGQVSGYNTEQKERSEYDRRVKFARAQKRTTYKNVNLIEPRYENGVHALFVVLQTLEPDLFPFEIVDYDTHSGIDVIAKTRDDVDVGQSMLRYVEFKHTLSSTFNHSFKYLHSIVCWNTKINHDEVIEDIASVKRKMIITPAELPEHHTRYMLDDPQEPHKIEVFVLETYLKEKLGIQFQDLT